MNVSMYSFRSQCSTCRDSTVCLCAFLLYQLVESSSLRYSYYYGISLQIQQQQWLPSKPSGRDKRIPSGSYEQSDGTFYRHPRYSYHVQIILPRLSCASLKALGLENVGLDSFCMRIRCPQGPFMESMEFPATSWQRPSQKVKVPVLRTCQSKFLKVLGISTWARLWRYSHCRWC